MFLCLKILCLLLASKQAQDHRKRSSDAQVMIVFVWVSLPVLHWAVVPPHRAVVPVDRYNRCLERLYHSRIGPKVVPAMYRSTTGIVSVFGAVLGRLWAGCSGYSGTTGAQGGCTAYFFCYRLVLSALTGCTGHHSGCTAPVLFCT